MPRDGQTESRPGSLQNRFAPWGDEVVACVTRLLLGPGPCAGVSILACLHGGLTTFILRQLAPVIGQLTRWVYVPVRLFNLGSDADVLSAIVAYTIHTLTGAAESTSSAPVGRLVAEMEGCLAQERRRATLCLDDGDANPQVVGALAGLCGSGEKLRLLVGCHRPLPRPLFLRRLPLLSPAQAAWVVGKHLAPRDLRELMRLTGGFPSLVQDLTDAMHEDAKSASWAERLAAAGQRLMDLGESDPSALSLRQALTQREWDLLLQVASGGGSVGAHPDLSQLIGLGLLRRADLGSVEFCSAIMARWIAQAGQAHCLFMTEESYLTLPAAEAKTRLKVALKESGECDCLVIDNLSNQFTYRGRAVHLTAAHLKLLRIVLESAARAQDRRRITRFDVLEQASPNGSRQWCYEGKSEIGRRLGGQVITLQQDAGMGLSANTRFAWVEKLGA